MDLRRIGLFTIHDLENSPTIRDSINHNRSIVLPYNQSTELQDRQRIASYIMHFGKCLRLELITILKAIVYLNRFYMFHSMFRFSYRKVAISCLFIAAKETDNRLPLSIFCTVGYRCENPEIRADIIDHEAVILLTLGFELDVELPHPHVIQFGQKINACPQFTESALYLAKKIYMLTTMFLKYRSTEIAYFCIYYTCEVNNWLSQLQNYYRLMSSIDKAINPELLIQYTKVFKESVQMCEPYIKCRITQICKNAKGLTVECKRIDKNVKNNSNQKSISASQLEESTLKPRMSSESDLSKQTIIDNKEEDNSSVNPIASVPTPLLRHPENLLNRLQEVSTSRVPLTLLMASTSHVYSTSHVAIAKIFKPEDPAVSNCQTNNLNSIMDQPSNASTSHVAIEKICKSGNLSVCSRQTNNLNSIMIRSSNASTSHVAIEKICKSGNLSVCSRQTNNLNSIMIRSSNASTSHVAIEKICKSGNLSVCSRQTNNLNSIMIRSSNASTLHVAPTSIEASTSHVPSASHVAIEKNCKLKDQSICNQLNMNSNSITDQFSNASRLVESQSEVKVLQDTTNVDNDSVRDQNASCYWLYNPEDLYSNKSILQPADVGSSPDFVFENSSTIPSTPQKRKSSDNKNIPKKSRSSETDPGPI